MRLRLPLDECALRTAHRFDDAQGCRGLIADGRRGGGRSTGGTGHTHVLGLGDHGLRQRDRRRIRRRRRHMLCGRGIGGDGGNADGVGC